MNDRINSLYRLAYFDIAVQEDQAWFCNYLYAAIFRMDLTSREIGLEAFVPNRRGTDMTDLYGPIAVYNEFLILAPRSADHILLYNRSKKTFQEIPISMDVMGANLRHKLFMEIKMIGDTAWFLPCCYPAIVKIDMLTLELTYYDGWYREVKKSMRDSWRFIFGRPAIKDESECLFPVWQDNLLLQFNFNTGKYFLHKVFEEGSCFSAAAFDGEDYWIAVRNKNMILKWENRKRMIVHDDFPENFKMSGNGRFVFLTCAGKEIIAVPQFGNGNMIVAVNRKTGIFRKVSNILTKPLSHMEKSVLNNGMILCSKKLDDTRLIVFSDFDGKTMDINLKSGEVLEFETILGEESRELYVQEMLFSVPGRIRIENCEISLKEYMKCKGKYCGDPFENRSMYSLESIGEKIFKEIGFNLLK